MFAPRTCAALLLATVAAADADANTTTVTTTGVVAALRGAATSLRGVVHVQACECSWIPRDDCQKNDRCAQECRAANPQGPCGGGHRHAAVGHLSCCCMSGRTVMSAQFYEGCTSCAADGSGCPMVQKGAFFQGCSGGQVVTKLPSTFCEGLPGV